MNILPFNIFANNNYSLAWTPPPSSVTFTIGSQTAIGGPSLDGYALQIVSAAVSMTSPAGLSNPVPVAANLTGGAIGVAYSETISVQGGASPYAFSVTSGAVPLGTTLNTSTGIISGTPTTAITYSFTIQVTDVNGNVGSQSFSIPISSPSAGGRRGFAYVA